MMVLHRPAEQIIKTIHQPTYFEYDKTAWRDMEVLSEGTMGSDDKPTYLHHAVSTTQSGPSNSVIGETKARVLNADAPAFVPGKSTTCTNACVSSATEGKRHIGPVITGKVEGVTMEFLADTGAEGTILSLRCLEQMPRDVRLKFLDSTGTIFMADGTKVQTRGPVLCQITIGSRTVLDAVFAADIEDHALLGWEAQLSLGVEYSIAGVNLVQPKTIRRVYNPQIRRVKLMADCELKARSEMIVGGSVEGTPVKGVNIVGPSQESGNDGIAVARAVVDATHGDCPVRLLNPTEHVIKLKKGDVIAGLEAADELLIQQSEETNFSVPSEIPTHLQELYSKTVEEGQLNNKTADDLKQLLIKHSHVFARDDNDLGFTHIVEHDINTGDSPAIRQPPRRIPMSQQEDCDKEIQSMLKKGIIEPGTSPWSSPIVLVRKKDGSLRFCVDYRRLNSVTKFDAYPLPRIDETLDALGGAQWFTTLDLISGYWQVGLTPEARMKSAFCVRSGLYLWRVMPFGLCNAPGTFERLMETILQGLQWSTCLVYLDDIVIFGRTEAELLFRMDEVFTRLSRAGLKIKPRKCKLFCRETDYLGHIISSEGVKVNPDKVAAVRDWPIPTCTTELRSFLGTAGYYRRFIAGFSSIAAPLHALTGDQQYIWTQDCQQAFEQLKEALCQAPTLAFPVPGAKFILDTDASDRGIGAVLSQLIPIGQGKDGEEVYEEKVLSYASRTLSVHEKRYCTTRKELLAVVWYLRHFRPYLYGQDFIVRTDHSSLQWLCSFWEPEGQVARWLQILGEYSFKVIHREGKKHSNADGLSRQGPCKQCGRQDDPAGVHSEPAEGICPERVNRSTVRRVTSIVSAVTLAPEWTPNQLAVWQEADIDLTPVLAALKTGQKPTTDEVAGHSAATKRYLQDWERLKLLDGVAYRIWYDKEGKENGYQLLTPRQIKPQILQVAHDSVTSGHYGERKTAIKVRKHFFWPNLLTDIRHYCRTCTICQQRKPAPTRPHHPLQQTSVGEPMQRVTMDILAFERATSRNNRYVLVIIDSLTKWAEALPMSDEKAETVARLFVDEFVCRLGVPSSLHSDQGRQFEAAVFKEMCRLLGIRKTRTTALHPQSDGQCERFNRTLLDLLAKLAVEHPEDWDLKLPFAMSAYRSTCHTTTGETPNRLMLGREVTTPLQLLTPPPPDVSGRLPWIETLHDNFQQAHANVQQHYGGEQRVQKNYHDHRQLGYTFEEGEKVWFLDPRPRKGTPYKLHAARWTGPFEVRKRISIAVYIIGLPGAKKTQVVTTARLKPYLVRDANLQPSQTEDELDVSNEIPLAPAICVTTPEVLLSDDNIPNLPEERETESVSGVSENEWSPKHAVKKTKAESMPVVNLRPQRNRRQPQRYGNVRRLSDYEDV